MVELNGSFDASQIEPLADLTPVPEGWYPAQITSTEQKPTAAAKRGETQDWLVEFVYTIVGPTHTNRKIYVSLNLGNSKPQATEMAHRELSSICHATGQAVIQRTEQVHNIPHMIHLKVEPAVFNGDGSEKYKAKNVVKGYKPLEQQQSNAMPQPQQPTGAMPGMVNPANNDPQGTFQAPQQAQPQQFQQPAQPAQPTVQQPQQFQQPVQQAQQPAPNAGRPAWEQ